ncbi:DUF1624 domain-containing protein [Dyadobacter pollutisoli]|uniref:Heparan-alpha-glucosaminide N-acetyltransferase domain-containing protein n=1 Tax=Dyadobacter pollutisoli TaxID=2910158 RepID=A0A9E8SLU8_9BACT|nr:heparan-alpha-glucosaminide N-acetyltransferase domain-containing protein [Dyadobacter pollutisoli]WAC12584.1 heparan-alpha-glucosaminide N-acetyltransferase domain-containing protein [Dyadobacter pollutisoli]
MSGIGFAAGPDGKISGQARIQSIDILRGLIMVLMVIDHVRVYSGLPPGGPSPGIFFTRWITHYCAPGFAFFAGTSIFLYGIRLGNKGMLARYLVTRGLLLVLLELTVIRIFWTFSVDYSEFVLLGVIWMLGWCMVLMAAFIWLRPMTTGIIGLAIIVFQDLFAKIPHLVSESSQQSFGRFWELIYKSGFETWPGISILYVIVPWIGVMAAGYGFGSILLLGPARRRKICLGIGLSAIALFLVIASIFISRQPVDAETPPFIFQLLNQRKYPASQLYLLMTLGPLIALIPWAEKAGGKLSGLLKVIGQVPMFFYLLHILLIHLTAFVVNVILYGAVHQEWYQSAPFTQMPEEYRWSLPLLYLVFAVDVVLLFAACRWYAGYKRSHPEQKWLKYI